MLVVVDVGQDGGGTTLTSLAVLFDELGNMAPAQSWFVRCGANVMILQAHGGALVEVAKDIGLMDEKPRLLSHSRLQAKLSFRKYQAESVIKTCYPSK